MNGITVTIFLCCVVLGIEIIYAGNWTEWIDVTECTAKPCRCGENKRKCEKGSRIQIRGCNVGKDGTPCQYKKKGAGPIREDRKCINKNKCPGWSEWSEWSDCRQDRSVGTKRTKERICNNPPPMHQAVLCILTNGDSGMHEYEDELNCQLDKSVQQPTEGPEMTTVEEVTGLPCCSQIETTTTGGGSTDYETITNQIFETTTTDALPVSSMSALDKAYIDDYDLQTRTCDTTC